MSVVYRGLDTVLERPVAIKVLHPHLSNREESRRRFQREARAIAKLSHPNIMQVFDFSETGADRSYIVMEFLEGCTLREALDKNPLKHPEVAAMIGVQLCDALKHAHDFGIIHRDIKPENVMIGREGVVKLTDFGIAQMVDAQAMTVTGALLGSPAHMCPEMIEGDTLDFRADVFSLGTVLYFAATGELPFTGKNAPLVLKAILEGDYLDAEMLNPRVGRRLSRIIDGCLARNVEDRYASVTDLRADLQAWLDDIGLGAVDVELAAYFHDPTTWEAELRPRLLAALEARGEAALRDRRIAAALEYFNRVLAIEPEHEKVLKLIRRIDQRRKLFVYVGAVAILLLATSTVIAISTFVMEDEEPVEEVVQPAVEAPAPDPAPAVEASARAVASALPLASRRADQVAAERLGERLAREIRAESEARAAALSDRGRPPAERLPTHVIARNGNPTPEADAGTADPVVEDTPPVAPATRIVSVTLGLFPPTAAVTIEGRPYQRSELARGVPVEVRATQQWLTVSAQHDCCQPTTRKIPLKDGLSNRTEIKDTIQLRWKPAQLVVRSDDASALVIVYDPATNAELLKGKVNAPLTIRVDDPQNPTRRIKVTVVTAGRGARSFPSVDVTSGQTSNLPAFFNN